MSRLCTQKMNRNRKLTKLVGDIYQPSDTFSVCDFGASYGSLLLSIKEELSNALLRHNGIGAFFSLELAFENHNIDYSLLHALLYTNYDQFLSILQHKA